MPPSKTQQRLKELFNWKFYVSYYTDLKHINDEVSAWKHFKHFGYFEKRYYNKNCVKVEEKKRLEEMNRIQALKESEELKRIQAIKVSEEKKRLEEMNRIQALKESEELKRIQAIKVSEEKKRLEEMNHIQALKESEEKQKAEELTRIQVQKELKKTQELTRVQKQKQICYMEQLNDIKYLSIKNKNILLNTHSNLNCTAGDTIMISNTMNILMEQGNKITLITKYKPTNIFTQNLIKNNYVFVVEDTDEKIVKKIDELEKTVDLIFIRNHEILGLIKNKQYLNKTVFYGLDIHIQGLKNMNEHFLGVIVQSDIFKKKYIDNGIDAKLIQIVEPIAYKYEFQIPERTDDEIRLIYCGTLRDEENILEIIEEFQKIHKERPEVVLKIVYGKIHGDDTFTKKVNEYIKNGVKGIKFKHNLSHRDACYEIATSDIGICWRKNGWGDNGEVSTKVNEYEMYDLQVEKKFSIKERLCVYTDLGLNTIDGSTMFIKNLLNNLSLFYNFNIALYHKHDINYLIEENLNNNIIKYKLNSKSLKLILLHKIKYIFIRCWEKQNTWLIPSSLNDKCFIYLSLDCKNTDNSIIKNNIIYQTEHQVRYYTEKCNIQFDNRIRRIRISPGGYLKDAIKTKSFESKLHVNYIGTLRDECYSNEMLDIMYECLNKNKNIHFYLIIGKIHKGVKYFLIERLKQLNNCFVGYNFNDDDISKIYKISHVSLSIWKTENEQNQHLLSSKMILGYLYDNIVLYLKPNTISDMQKHSSIGMNNINELSTNLNDIYNTLKQTKTIKMCRNVIINYSFDYNIFSLKQLIQSPCNFDFVHIFNISFDYIYGLYINDKELNTLNDWRKSPSEWNQ